MSREVSFRPTEKGDRYQIQVDGQDVPFQVKEQSGSVVLETTASNVTMRPQTFTKPDALHQFVSDAVDNLKSRNKI